MGWSIFQKLVRTQSSSQSTARRIIPLINNPILNPPPPPPFPAATTPLSLSLTSESRIQIPRTEDWSFNHSPSSHHYYPSFSFRFFLKPNSSSGLIKTEVDGCVSEDSRPAIWADSVKKKRKRKMNKHKLRKLRKRLRRKT